LLYFILESSKNNSVRLRQTGRGEARLVRRKESWNLWLLLYPFKGSMIPDLEESSVPRKKIGGKYWSITKDVVI
jgi:hypothetical protein